MLGMSDERTRIWRPWRWLAGLLATAAFIVLLLWGPWWIEGHRLKEGGKLVSSAGIIITGLRTALIAVVAGAFTAAGLYYTREKHRLEREQFQHAQQQFAESVQQFQTTLTEAQKRDERQSELIREDQVTGRYVEAIKLLASEKLHERLGGIYSLERIMKDSEKDHDTVVEVLSAYIRNQIEEQQKTRSASTTPDRPVDSDHQGRATVGATTRNSAVKPPWAEDMKAACSVLARSPKRDRPHAADLSGVDMNRLDLRDLTFTRANLQKANLMGASLERVNLQEAILVEADLEEADLLGADLVRADLVGARLVGASLLEAGLMEARLMGANLAGASLLGASLEGANLEKAILVDAELLVARMESANLRGAGLDRANLRGASLERAKLEGAKGLTVAQLVAARIDMATKLPTELVNDERIKDRIAECEAERAVNQREPLPEGEGSE
jgi:uncharacterized protein YjbI with pentapeptide repeats